MPLSKAHYQEIMQEYEEIRQTNYRLGQERLTEVYEAIPDVEAIDRQIAKESLDAARKMLFQPENDQKDALHTRIEAFKQQKQSLLLAHGYPRNYLEPVYDCEACKDTGYIGTKKCACFEKRIRLLLYKQSNLMDNIHTQNFRKFRMDYYSTEPFESYKLTPRDNMQKIVDESYQFIHNFQRNPGQNLLLYGNPGVGKTFLTTCIAAEIIRIGKSVIYLTSQELFEHLADSKFRREEQQEKMLPFLLEADLLIIDDLGTEMNNAFVNSQLFHCINERMLHKKSTIISTNFSLKQLNLTYTERISSRLIQFYTLLHIYGEDIRIKKAFSTIDERPVKMI